MFPSWSHQALCVLGVFLTSNVPCLIGPESPSPSVVNSSGPRRPSGCLEHRQARVLCYQGSRAFVPIFFYLGALGRNIYKPFEFKVWRGLGDPQPIFLVQTHTLLFALELRHKKYEFLSFRPEQSGPLSPQQCFLNSGSRPIREL